MIWKAHNNEIITLKQMTKGHIKASLNYLYNSNLTELNGISKPLWVMSMKQELHRRKELERVITNSVQFICEGYNEVKYNIKYKNEKEKTN